MLYYRHQQCTLCNKHEDSIFTFIQSNECERMTHMKLYRRRHVKIQNKTLNETKREFLHAKGSNRM